MKGWSRLKTMLVTILPIVVIASFLLSLLPWNVSLTITPAGSVSFDVGVLQVYADPGWLTGYDYREQITINGSTAGAQTNYTMELSVHSGSGSDSGDDVYLDSLCSEYPYDIRFTQSDETTELDFWIEDDTADPATFWIEFNSIPADPDDVNYYIYYGDSDLPTVAETATRGQIQASGYRVTTENVMSFTAEALWTFNGKQYTAFLNETLNVIVAVRTLPSGNWTTQDTGKGVTTPDSHKTVNIGIDPNGYIHIMFGMHDAALNGHYIVSTNAEDITAWTDKTQMTGSNETSVTYPTFFSDGSNLYCIYRDGMSGDGELYLNKYIHGTPAWSALHHPFINTVAATGSPYLDHAVVDGSGNFHISWVWRSSVADAGSNNKVCYAKSLDSGATWKESDGTGYSIPITYAASDVADPVGVDSGLVNANDVAVDTSNYPHIVYYKADANGWLNYYHTWFNGSSWAINRVTTFKKFKTADFPTGLKIGRPAIVISGTQVIVLFRYEDDEHFYAAVASSPYTSWEFHQLGSDNWELSEINFDRIYWASDSKLHIFASEVDKAAGSTPVYVVETTPSTWSYGYAFSQMFGASDVVDTFLLGDDFNRSDGAAVRGGWTETNDIGSIDTNQLKLLATDEGTYRDAISKAHGLSSGKIFLEAKSKFTSATGGEWAYFRFYADSINELSAWGATASVTYGDDSFRYVDDALWHDVQNYTPGTWYKMQMIYDFTGNTVAYLIDGASKAAGLTPYDNTATSNLLAFGVLAMQSEAQYFDYVFIRKYVSPEPTWGAWGDEETACDEDISNAPAVYSFGAVSTNTAYNSTISHFTVTNNSGGAIDVTVQATNMTSGGSGSESLAPTGQVTWTNLDGSYLDVDDDPDSPDGNWGDAIADGTDILAHVSFPTPTGNPTVGAGLQDFAVWVKRSTASSSPALKIDLYESGGFVSTTSITASSVTSDSGELFTGTWNAGSLGTADGSAVEAYVYGTKAGSSGGITLRAGSQSGTGSSATSFTATKPTSISDGDYVVIIVGKDDDVVTWSIPGFTFEQAGTGTGNDIRVGIGYKYITDAGSETDYTVTHGDGTEEYEYWIGALSGVDSGTPEDVAFSGGWTNIQNSETPTAPEITTNTNGAYVFAVCYTDYTATMSNPGSPWSTLHNSGATVNILLASSQIDAVAGLTGDAVFTGAGSTDDSYVGQFAFRPTGSTASSVDVGAIEWNVDYPTVSSWTLTDDATNGASSYGLKVGLDDGDDNFDIVVKLNSPYNNLVAGLADSDTQDWGLWIWVPTSFDSGDIREGTVTLTGVCQ